MKSLAMLSMCLVALFAMDGSQSEPAKSADSDMADSNMKVVDANDQDTETQSPQIHSSETPRTQTNYMSGTVGSVHDFSEETHRPGDACSACHIPHVQAVRVRKPTNNTDATDENNTENRDAIDQDVEPAVELFRIQGQRQTFVPDRYTPGPTSLICLGCHDGTVASSTIGSAHAMLAGVREGFSVPEGFAWRDHPIGVPYPSNNREYRPESFVTADGTVRLPEGRMECVSCHDPHNSAGIDKLLVKSNRRSALCLTCHVK
ncbi:MAG TPA: cytochrome c3 family protein [Phycisphaerae bacterium]|nr:cytochrome c3 family protein [Phycisphaerae bacterium]